MMSIILCRLLSLISGLIGITFFTVFERNLLGFAQTRRGPNKVGPVGLAQPLSDAIKLLSKSQIIPSRAFGKGYLIGPFRGLFLGLVRWGLLPPSP